MPEPRTASAPQRHLSQLHQASACVAVAGTQHIMHANPCIGSRAGLRLPYTSRPLYEQVIKREAALGVALRTLHKAGVEGVMIDVWWGIVEHAPGQYDFSAYRRLLQKIADSGLKAQVRRLVLCLSSGFGVQVIGVLGLWVCIKGNVSTVPKSQPLDVQAVMSFHAAGGNVGDTCHITLPQWVLDVGDSNPDIFYTDKEGFRNRECLSLGCDGEALFAGRTPIDIYRNFMSAFADTFQHMFGELMTTIRTPPTFWPNIPAHNVASRSLQLE